MATDENGWCDILDNGDLKKKIIKNGDSSKARPERGSTVTIKLITKLDEDDKIVQSETFEEIDIIVGDYDVIQGLDLAVPLMEEGEVAHVVIKPRFGYGKLGKGDEIPPNATLNCEIHLLAIKWIDEDTEISIDERIRMGNRKKDRGNFWYGRGDYSTAIHCYKSALRYLVTFENELNNTDLNNIDENDVEKLKDSLEISDPKIKELVELRSVTFNNQAAAQLKIDALDAALESIDSALMIQPNNVKALFRKGKILSLKGNLVSAIETLKKALTMSTDNDTKLIQQELSKNIAKRKKELVTEKDLYKRMLQLDKPIESKQKNNKLKGPWVKLGLIGGTMFAIASVVAYKMMM